MQPIIGIIPLYDDDKDSIWMVPGYLRGVEEAGAVPIILPLTTDERELETVASLCDGFLFTGGHDVDPKLYGQESKPQCGRACKQRDTMEKIIFDYALALNRPIFGICRGIQLINALCGGTLYQDLPSEYKSDVEHHMQPPYDQIAHTITIEKDTPLFQWFQTDTIGVNSYHHQGVKELAKTLKPMAHSEDGLTEAVYMPDKPFVIAVQWHPEFNYKKEKSSQILFQRFVEACRREL